MTGRNPMNIQIEKLYKLLKNNVSHSELRELCRTLLPSVLRDLPLNYSPSEMIHQIVECSIRTGRVEQVHSWAQERFGKSNQTESEIEFLIITALEEEFDAVRRKFQDVRQLDQSNGVYSAIVTSNQRELNVILAYQLFSGQSDAAAMTSTLCGRYKPRCVLLVGIAGGNQNNGVKLGDIIISNLIEDGGKGKVIGSGEVQLNWRSHTVDAGLLRASRDLKNSENWQKFISVKRPNSISAIGFRTRIKNLFSSQQQEICPSIVEGTTISVPNVIKEDNKIGGKWLKEFDTRNRNWLGVEMECGGAITAISNYATEPKPKFLMIRSVTDFANSYKNDLWHPYACDVAAAYAYALIVNSCQS